VTKAGPGTPGHGRKGKRIGFPIADELYRPLAHASTRTSRSKRFVVQAIREMLTKAAGQR